MRRLRPWLSTEGWRTTLPARPEWLRHPAAQVGFTFAAFGLVLAAGVLGQALVGEGSAGRALLAAVLGATFGLVAYLGAMWLLEGSWRREELAPRHALAETLGGMGLGALYMTAVMVWITFAGGFELDGIGAADGLTRAFAAAILAGVVEELAFRGVLLRRLAGVVPPVAALGITALLFGVAHLGNESASGRGVVAIALEAGLLLGVTWLITRRLWLAIGLHIGWNATLAGVFGAPLSGEPAEQGLLDGRLTGSEGLTGGPFGPEASWPAVVLGLLLTVALVVGYARREEHLPDLLRG